ncbi:enoyl-CoA hydratase/isomerase [Chromobacterium vaccinii]|uniref:enoyl-CoA hydratase/isomerase n=1 Tax=Chromobacterium vaccinii TaxID=1108595 RepID=UPI0031D0A93C
MDLLSRSWKTLQVRLEDEVCFIRIHRPDAGNAINDMLIEEMSTALSACDEAAKVVVLEGQTEVFCAGADFRQIEQRLDAGDANGGGQHPEPLYRLWQKLACGPYVTIAHVKGKANAGGIGFVSACDIVLSDDKATFGLSELLFGLMPACVLPFLIRRVGFSKANYMTLTTQPVSAALAREWGLVDACDENSDKLLRAQLLRLRRMGKTGIARYKRYAAALDDSLQRSMAPALAANFEVFSDADNLEKIARFVRTGRFPWEGQP